MSYYHTCEYCGANLDPGERCDCIESVYRKYHSHNKSLRQYMEEMEHGKHEHEGNDYRCAVGY